VLRDLKDFDAAQSAARRAIALNPAAPQAIEELGWSFYYDDQLDESINAFRHALRMAPEYAPAYFALATALRELVSFIAIAFTVSLAFTAICPEQRVDEVVGIDPSVVK